MVNWRTKVHDEENQQVTVRRLPDGDIHTAQRQNLDGQMMHIDLKPSSGAQDLGMGDLVEVTDPQYLYLGEVVGRQAATLIVGVEHTLDRDVLGVIRQVWHGPADD